jgi:hypothetical protein
MTADGTDGASTIMPAAPAPAAPAPAGPATAEVSEFAAASAVVAARQRIVEGAVGMMEAALGRLSADGLVDLDDERRAAMVSNMMVVLYSDQATQPIVNTGTLYS